MASAGEWKTKYSDNLHKAARTAMSELTEYIKARQSALSRPVDSLDSLRFAMATLQAIRAKESEIEADISPIMDMYALLEHYLAPGLLSKEEMDQKSVLRSSWRKLLDKAVEVSAAITATQGGFKRKLLVDVRSFVTEVKAFRADYLAHGPMVRVARAPPPWQAGKANGLAAGDALVMMVIRARSSRLATAAGRPPPAQRRHGAAAPLRGRV